MWIVFQKCREMSERPPLTLLLLFFYYIILQLKVDGLRVFARSKNIEKIQLLCIYWQDMSLYYIIFCGIDWSIEIICRSVEKEPVLYSSSLDFECKN